MYDTIDTAAKSVKGYTREQLIALEGTATVKQAFTESIFFTLNSILRDLNPTLPQHKNILNLADVLSIYQSYAAEFVPPVYDDVTPLTQVIKGINSGTWFMAKPDRIPPCVQAFITSQTGTDGREMRAFLRKHATKFDSQSEPLPLPEKEPPMPEEMPDMSRVEAFFKTVTVKRDDYRYFKPKIESDLRNKAIDAGIAFAENVAMDTEWLYYIYNYPETAEFYLQSMDSDDPNRQRMLDKNIRTAFRLPDGEIPSGFMRQFRRWLEGFLDKEEEIIVIPPSPGQALEPAGQPLARVDHEQTTQDLLEKARMRMETEADLRMDAIIDGLAVFDDISGFGSLSPDLQPDTNVFTGKRRIGLYHIYDHYTSAESVLGASHPKVEQIGLRLAADGMTHLKHLDYDDARDKSIMGITMEVLLHYDTEPGVLDEFVEILSDPKFRERSKKYINTVQLVRLVRDDQHDEATAHLNANKLDYDNFTDYLDSDQLQNLLAGALNFENFSHEQIFAFVRIKDAKLESAVRGILSKGTLLDVIDTDTVVHQNI